MAMGADEGRECESRERRREGEWGDEGEARVLDGGPARVNDPTVEIFL